MGGESSSLPHSCLVSSPLQEAGSRKKTATINHIAETYNFLNTKYGRGTFWIIAGDSNELKLGPILALNSNLRSVVKKSTRINVKNPSKSTILDNIITDLHRWFQEPLCLPQINADTVRGKPSDHLTVVMEPLNVINNKPSRQIKNITVRPIPESGLDKLGLWIKNQQWKELEEAHDIDTKVNIFHSEVMKQINIHLPEKNIKITSDDSPWSNEKVKHLKRLKNCEYNKHRKSFKWTKMNDKYLKVIKIEKQKHDEKMVKDLKQSEPNQWYSKLKRLCSYDLEKQEVLQCDELSHLEDHKQADILVEHFSNVRSKFDALQACDI